MPVAPVAAAKAERTGRHSEYTPLNFWFAPATFTYSLHPTAPIPLHHTIDFSQVTDLIATYNIDRHFDASI